MSTRRRIVDPSVPKGVTGKDPMPLQPRGFGQPSSWALSGSSLPRVFRPQRAVPSDAMRPTRAEVNLAHLRHNLRLLRRVVGSDIPVWAVLKADGYGHGAKAVARTLERAGAGGICVALVEEGIELREAGIRAPILVMGGFYGRVWPELIHYGLTPVLQHLGQVEALAEEVRFNSGEPVSVHLKVDTGMARLGASVGDLDRIAQAVKAHPEVRLEALMTHFACADQPDPAVLEPQLERFRDALDVLAAAGIRPRLRHAANSAALLGHPQTHFDLVRPGLALFGVHPCGADRSVRLPALLTDAGQACECTRSELRPVMSVLSQLVSVRDVPVGETVGYGATWTALRPSRIATFPMGYADGLVRGLSNRGQALVRGVRAPIVGMVSMDMTMLDVTDVPGATVGDEVVLLGSQKGPLGSDEITATEIADHLGTIPWEVLTNISRRVPRFYREP